ncbi:hypothetical protein [Xanthomonas campestris]|uniref:hypothetical protein n=1 Tax=Xanthomonas campestris TaxID=339 RepID=UPI000E3269DF|nr:hypothetical protein [Xanthomonas campestris]RFF52926.1 hypothetical protein D0A41_22210 [Xanthomonas campestris]
MLVKILDAEPAFVEELKRLTSQKTGSKAFMHAAEQYGPLHVYNLTLADQVTELRTEVARLQGIIEGARSAAAVLLDQVAQSDLLDFSGPPIDLNSRSKPRARVRDPGSS